ncbi:hypothetical protein ACLKA7_005515 [Drosophila subpalustris]
MAKGPTHAVSTTTTTIAVQPDASRVSCVCAGNLPASKNNNNNNTTILPAASPAAACRECVCATNNNSRNTVRPYATTGNSFVYACVQLRQQRQQREQCEQYAATSSSVSCECVWAAAKQQLRSAATHHQQQNTWCARVNSNNNSNTAPRAAQKATTHLVCTCGPPHSNNNNNSNTAPRSATSSVCATTPPATTTYGEGIHTDTDKIAAVRQLQPPTTCRELRRCLGIASWYRRFVPNFADIVQPLSLMLKKGQKWDWKPEQQAAFEELRARLSEAPVLACRTLARSLYWKPTRASADWELF